jgi:hypothetical protein
MPFILDACLGLFKLIKRKKPEPGIPSVHSKPTMKLFMQYFNVDLFWVGKLNHYP